MSKFLVHTGAEVIAPKVRDMVTIKGNIAAKPVLTDKGMCFILVAWERANDPIGSDGRQVPSFISVKCWGDDAIQAAKLLDRGDRIKIEAERLVDNYPDSRDAAAKAKYPRDGFEYRLDFLEVFFKKEVTAPVKKPRKSKKTA